MKNKFSLLLVLLLAVAFFSKCDLFEEEESEEETTEKVVLFDELPQNANPGLSNFVIRSRWQKSDLTYYIANFSPDMSTPDQRTAIRDAINKWASVSPLSFTEVNSAGQADIVIGFGSNDHCQLYQASGVSCQNAAFDGPSGVLAHCYFPGQGIVSGDAHFDEAENWVSQPSSGFGISLPSVALHEFGHGLGLEHSQDPSAVMYASYNSSDVKTNLRQDDINGIQAIYGKPNGTPPPPPTPPNDNPDVKPCGSPSQYDTDGDGVDNYTELYIIGTNPNDCDTDNDGLPDLEVYYGLNPLNADTDGDGVSDGTEIQNGSNPYIPDQGNVPGSIAGHYEGQDNVGGLLTFDVNQNGSAFGTLGFWYNGYWYNVPLNGGLDVSGNLLLVSYDYYWAYYGEFTPSGAQGAWQTAGGAQGTWFVLKKWLKDPFPVLPRNQGAEAGDYSPVLDKKHLPSHPIHQNVSWK